MKQVRKERETMAKQWATLEGVLDGQLLVPALNVTIEGKALFTQEQVWFEMYQKYSEFSFLYPASAIPQEHFQRMYDNYIANMGEQFARMVDAVERKYNPINNYEMIESGADGHTQSKKTNKEKLDNIAASRNGGYDTSRHGTETTKKDGTEETGRSYLSKDETTYNQQISDHYDNAFNSGFTDGGTHTTKDVTTLPSFTDTTTFNERKDETEFTNFGDKVTYENDQTETIRTNVEGTIQVTGNTTTKGVARNEGTEEFDNDVEVSAKQQQPDGTETTITLGDKFTDGTMHVFTRSGNIGVTTSMQMVSGEMEREKLNLLRMWVSGFIMEYCTFLGVEE